MQLLSRPQDPPTSRSGKVNQEENFSPWKKFKGLLLQMRDRKEQPLNT